MSKIIEKEPNINEINKYKGYSWLHSTQPCEYSWAMDFMHKYRDYLKSQELDPAIWLLEHTPVYTAGTSAKSNGILNNKFNIPIYVSNRGGQHTYHGPGQRTVYLIMELKKLEPDIHKYIRFLEEWIISTLQKLEISSFIRKDRVGVWVKHPKTNLESKICAIGIHISKWITSHGIALNVSPNLEHYQGIIPCGLANFGITSIQEFINNITLNEVDDILIERFYKTMNYVYNK